MRASKEINILTFISIFLIIILAIANNGGANDYHFDVINIISKYKVLPDSTQCWQCYHPKLFHFLAAQVWNLFHIESLFWEITSTQLLNASFGVGAVLLFRNYIKTLPFNKTIVLVVYALVVLNPRFISIFSQATNDGLIIFLGNLGFYYLVKTHKKPSLKSSIMVILAVVLGSMTKFNFGVYFVAVIIVLGLLAVLNKNYSFSLKKGYLGTLTLSILLTIFAVLSFNGYYKKLIKGQDAFTYNTPLYPFPEFFNYPDHYIPGIQTIYSGYFKFHFFDLIKNPKLPAQDREDRFKHMNSYFSQIYGRTHFLYFDNWPEPWQDSNPVITNIGRASIALALLPSVLFVLGFFLIGFSIIQSVSKKRPEDFLKNHNWVSLLVVFGYLMFGFFFSAFGRMFTFMKVIYLLPGLMAMIQPLAVGHEKFFQLIQNKKLIKGYSFYIAILIILYMIPLIQLIIKQFAQKGDFYGW